MYMYDTTSACKAIAMHKNGKNGKIVLEHAKYK